MTKRVLDLMAVSGILLLLCVRLHHLFANPELTEAEALLFYWPCFAAVLALVLPTVVDYARK